MDVNERLAQILDRTGNYRILRRVRPAQFSAMSDADRRRAGLSTGIVLDTETTGLGPRDEPIELGMVSFAYDPVTLDVDHVIAAFCALRQPSRPIPPEVTRLTGISNGDVRGRAIDPAAVSAFVAGATIVIAHNAAFDRPVCERTWPVFADLPWACSLRQIDWRGEGFEAAKLGGLLAERRLFHDGHRALDDVVALLYLLRQPLILGRTGFRTMMETAAATTLRVWAVAAPFGRKDDLKARGYRWSDGGERTPRAWNREVPEAQAAGELAWLRSEIYGDPAAKPRTTRLTAFERFSVRANRFDPEAANACR